MTDQVFGELDFDGFYKWAEDLNDNGIGIRLLNEELDGTRYKDIAF